MDSRMLSRVSSTLSSDSVADLFPFDSEIFVDTGPNDVSKAHGSPPAVIYNFISIGEWFLSIADCFNISADGIIFCTVSTFKIDMEKLFLGNLGCSNMVFAHIKAQAIEVELTKTEGLFGLSIASRSIASSKKNVNDGMQTLRFNAKGGVMIEEGGVDKEMIGRLDEILDSVL
ncbi:unnamed protein product [Angiostrongylus costaricensis]|uniref:WS_DGAT_C domain-containing protein n=1 Tax=Angiostrongylus costaricensis TaxID=334426 RepID=A0A0R3PDE9_ANGCS|nr:unnamed protein product [Angiostrongylus costaricensis]